MNVGCKLTKLLYSQVWNILNSNRNWSAVTSLMTSKWEHSKQFVSTSWLSIILSLVNIRCKLIKLWYSQARNMQNYSRKRSSMTSLMTSSWRHSIKFVNTSWLSIISSLVIIGYKLIKLLYSQVRNILNPSRNWSSVWRHHNKICWGSSLPTRN